MSRSLTTSEPATQALFQELADAWKSLGGAFLPPRRVDVLKKHHHNPQVCRLFACVPGGGDVVAKRCTPDAVEPLFYEHVLAAIPAFAPRFHGIARGVDDGQWWLFIEHVAGDEYRPATSDHRRIAAHWLGAVHSTTSRMPLGQLLPERGLAHYRSRLRSGLQAISKVLSASSMAAEDRSRLVAAARRCASLDRQWDALEAPLDAVRPGLVHGDLRPKNTRIRRASEGAQLVAFDWETAGWGVPVADLAVFSVGNRWRDLPRIMDYHQITGRSAGAHMRRIATIGRVFRLVASIDWEGKSLCSAWPQRSIRRIAWCDVELSECMRALSMEP